MLCWLSECPRCFDSVLPADYRGFLAKMRAADLVETAPLRLLRSTRCILPGTDGHDACPSRPSCWKAAEKRLTSWSKG